MLTYKQTDEFDLDISDLFQAYFDCRKNKRNSKSALMYEENFEENIFILYEKLKSKTYAPGKSDFFIVLQPKPREIWAAQFEDRIIHHLFYNKFYSIFTNSFIFDSYSCIPRKGTLNAAKRLNHFVKSCTKNYSENCFYLQCDIMSFFTNIDKDIVFSIIIKKITNNWWIWLLKTILYYDPTENYVCKSSIWKQKHIEKHKSLFNAKKNVGLPIGNLTSQFIANIYLNELDQYTKHKLKIKYYIRYADDIVILHNNPKQLNFYYKKLCDFVERNLKLKFHPSKKIINNTKVVINFVGYIIKPYRIYVRRRTLHNMYVSASKNKDDPEKLRSSINSYLGILKHSNSYKKKKLFAEKHKYIKFDKHLNKVIL